jgi:hypothetical protein
MEPDSYYYIRKSSPSPRPWVTYVNMLVLGIKIYEPPSIHKMLTYDGEI